MSVLNACRLDFSSDRHVGVGIRVILFLLCGLPPRSGLRGFFGDLGRASRSEVGIESDDNFGLIGISYPQGRIGQNSLI